MQNLDGRIYRGNLYGTLGSGVIQATPYIITFEAITGGHRLNVNKGNEVSYIDIMDGEEGFSPSIEVEEIQGGHKLIITTKDGVQTVNIMDGQGGGKGYYHSINKRKDYLYEVNYEDIDYDYAKEYFEGAAEEVFSGACSSVSKGSLYGRKFDWLYDNVAEFVVNVVGYAGRHASHGIASGITTLTNNFVESGEWSDLYRIVPFALLDGQNDTGLICSTNVVPTDYGENVSVPTVEERERISGSMLVRYILDKFDDPLKACQYIQRYVSVYFSDNLHAQHYEQHYMIKKGDTVYCLEFVNNEAVYYNITERPYLTNFLIYDTVLNADNTVYTPYTQDEAHNAMDTNKITERGCGLERWNLIVNSYDSIDDIDDMRSLLHDLNYTNTYTITDDDKVWYTELVGLNGLTAATPYSEFAPTLANARHEYSIRDREAPVIWQSVHSVIYEDDTLNMYVVVQEDNTEIKFGFYNYEMPTKLSELENDVGYITVEEIPEETDPTVPSWAKNPEPPTAEDIGAVSTNQGSENAGRIMGINTVGDVVPVDAPVAGVSSVNGKTGTVTISASELGAYEKPDDGIPYNDLSEDVKDSLDKADTAYQKDDAGIPKTDLTSSVRSSLDKADTAYQKDATGIPKSDLAVSIQSSLGKADSAVQPSALASETTARQQGDNNLQGQIDTLVSKSDVVDVVGTYDELEEYDTSDLGNNDVVKVLLDSTKNDSRTYYRWVITSADSSWVYVGEESIGYTKEQANELLDEKQDVIDDLDNIRTLAEGAVQNEADPVFVASPAHGITSQDITNWNNKQNAISNLSTIESGAAAGATAVQPEDLGAVATSNSYNDLDNKPTIPSKTTDLDNDAGFITAGDVPDEVVIGNTQPTSEIWIDTSDTAESEDPAVRWDVSQNLANSDKSRARNNISAASQSDMENVQSAIGNIRASKENAHGHLYVLDGANLKEVFGGADALYAALAEEDYSQIHNLDYYPIKFEGTYRDYGEWMALSGKNYYSDTACKNVAGQIASDTVVAAESNSPAYYSATISGTKRYFKMQDCQRWREKSINMTAKMEANINVYWRYGNSGNLSNGVPHIMWLARDGIASLKFRSSNQQWADAVEQFATGDGTTATYTPTDAAQKCVRYVCVNGALQTYNTAYTVNTSTGAVTFKSGYIPASGAAILISRTTHDHPWNGSAVYKTFNDPTYGLLRLIDDAEFAAHIYGGADGSGMRYGEETRTVANSTGVSWADRGKMFLPIESEVWGLAIYGSKDTWYHLPQLPVFANGGKRRISKAASDGGLKSFWWLATSNSVTDITYVHYDGYASAIISGLARAAVPGFIGT